MTPNASAAALYTGRLIAVIAFLIAPVAVFSSKAMVPLLLILCLGLIAHDAVRGLGLPRSSKPLWIGAVLLVGWGALTAIWAVNPRESLTLAGSLFALLAIGFYVLGSLSRLELPDWRPSKKAFLTGLGTAAVIFLIEAATDNFLTRTGRFLDDETIRTANQLIGINVDAFLINGTVLLSLLIWPALVLLNAHGRRGLMLLLLIGAGFAVFEYGNAAALIALAAGFAVVIGARINSRIAAGVIAGGFVILVLVTPLVTMTLLGDKDMKNIAVESARKGVPGSMIGRMFIYDFVSDRISEKPLGGWGLNSSRSIPGANEKYIVYDQEGPGPRGQFIIEEAYLPLHPHNQALQIWLELGAVGALLIAGLGGLLLWQMRLDGPTGPTRAMFFGLVTSIIAYDMLSFGAWQSWWIASQFLALAMMLLTQRSLQQEPAPRSSDTH